MCTVAAISANGEQGNAMTIEAKWFGTGRGGLWHALSAGSNYSVCHRGIVLDLDNPMPGPNDVDRLFVRPRRQCSKCMTRLETLARMAEKRNARLTATQTWEKLDLAEREALLGWFLGSYAPSTYAQHYPLVKNETLTGAVCTVSQHWKGATA